MSPYHTIPYHTILRVVHNLGFCGFHFFVQVEIEDTVLGVDWNELFSSVPIHHLSKCILMSWFFSVHWTHETTVGSLVEILSSFARDFSSTAQHCANTSESSVQRSTHTVFIVTLKLPSSTIRDTITTCCSMESSVSCSIWTKVQWACVHCTSCVQVHFRRCEPLRTAQGTEIKTSK